MNIKGINITTLVGDNLPVQKSALDHSPGSLQEDNIETNVALPIFFPCICHTLSLALNDFIKDNEIMSFLMDNIIIFTKIFRSKPIVAHLDLVCPSFCKTRWTNQFDIFLWTLKHLSSIENLCKNATADIASLLLKIPNLPDMIYEKIPKFVYIFTPMKDLITFLEGDHTPACYLYPVIETFRKKIKDLINDSEEDFSELLTDLLEKIDKRLSFHYGYFELRTLYYLTPSGREHARKTVYQNFLEEGKDGYHEKIDINVDYPNSEKLISSLIKSLGDLIKRKDSLDKIFRSFSEKFILKSVSINQDDFDDDVVVFEPIENEEPEVMEVNDDSKIKPYCECIEKWAKKFNYAKPINLQKNDEYCSLLIIDWGDWIMKPITSKTLCSMMHRDPVCFWNAAKQENYLSEFAHFVLKLLPLVSSEASVERKLWQQRVISPPDRTSNSEIMELDKVLLSDSMDD